MSQKFYVSGTKCQSCEVLLEREIKKIPGVSRVEVSHQKQSIKIDAEEKLTKSEVSAAVKQHGYKIKNSPVSTRLEQKINWKRVGGALIIVFALYYTFENLGLLAFSPTTSNPSDLIAIFVIGLIASVSSCTAVVGGLVVAVSSSLAQQQKNQTKQERLRPHLYFNFGRLLGFAVFGAIIGWLGSAIQLSSTVNGLFVIVIAVLMIAIGISLLDLLPSNVVRTPKWIAHKIHDLAESKDPSAPFLLGALTFFLPCGFTQSMQLFALSLQNPFQAAVVMTVFALGTMPALLGLSSLSALSSGKTLKKVTQVAGVLVLVLGLSNVVNGATLLGINPQAVLAQANESGLPQVEDGVQKITMRITDRLVYSPDVLTVKVGIPVEWEIIGGEFLGCANTLVAPGLGIDTNLKTGSNFISFTPQKPGRYTFSCSMGMFRGTMIVIE